MASLTDLGRRLRSEGPATDGTLATDDIPRTDGIPRTDADGAVTTAGDDATPNQRFRERVAAWLGRVRRTVTIGDIAAVVVLVSTTVHLVARDGGRSTFDILPVLVVAALGTLALAPSLRGSSRLVVWLVAAWALAPLIALAAAEIRAGAVRPLVASALAPPVALAARHLWRRPFGPAMLGVLLAVAVARSWYGTFLAWWGGSDARPTWLALSWHNQSGTLMGTAAVAAAAVAAITNGRARAVALVLGGATLAGCWLSGSRGAIIATAIGMAAVVLGLVRGRELRRALPTLVGVLLVGVVGIASLEAMVQGGDGQPLTSRDQSAAQNLSARFGHWQAAVGMATSRPATGWGPGSYRWASVEHYPGDTNLTSSAHNEYLEVAAESGIVGAAPVWFAVAAVAFLAIGVIGRRRRDDHLDVPERDNDAAETVPHDRRARSRRAGVLAAAGGVTVLGVHAGLDFDWDYPLLLALFAIGAGVLWAQHTPRHTQRRAGVAATAVATLATVFALTVAVTATALTNNDNLPWDLDGRLYAAVAAATAGDIATARGELETAATWNPGARTLPVVTAVVEHHAGNLDDAGLAASVTPWSSAHSDQLLVARRLQDTGNAVAARTIAEDLVPVLEARAAWGVQSSVVEVAALVLLTETTIGDCASAQALVPRTLAWARNLDVSAEQLDAVIALVSDATDCRLT